VTDRAATRRDVVQSYLDAPNRHDHAQLRTLAVPQIERAMGTEVVTGIDVLALHGREHLKTTLLQHIELEGRPQSRRSNNDSPGR
jgi:hypothetical protein